MTEIQKELFALSDAKFRLFTSKLMPTVALDRVIGVRTPELRNYCKSLDIEKFSDFMKQLPHKYYEEDNLHAFIIEKISDYDRCIYELERFLPYVDNWATCDMLRPKVLGNQKVKLISQIKKWLKSKDVYVIRFAIEMLMLHFLDDEFKAEYLDLVASIENDEYYIKMMQAWYFATALAKQYDDAVKYIVDKRLDKWVHNKTISKACESYRVDKSHKEYLKTLK